MMSDENGFLCPVIDADSCVECGLCQKSCPGVNPMKLAQSEPKAYAAYSKDEVIRMQSSSGGVFTEIARVVLEKCGAVYGAAYNRQFEVVHICVETEEDLAKLRGAKYAQSDLLRLFPEIKTRLDGGQMVLFSGTPCQVGGLKAFLRKDYENLLTVDFVCLSVPSPMAWKEYIRYRAQTDCGGEQPINISLRSKSTGWSRYTYSNLFEYTDGRIYSAKSADSLYMKLFGGGYISRECCESCRFKGYRRASDLTVGDFWGIWDIAPEMDDNKGTSVILVQSAHGAELLAQIEGSLALKEVSLEDASRQNQAMIRAAHSNTRRDEALQRIRKEGYNEIQALIDEDNKRKESGWRKIIQKIGRMIGFGL